MFDVIKLAKKDADLYPYLKKICPCGYHVIEMHDDPNAETELFQHVGGGRVVGRVPVLKSLRAGGWLPKNVPVPGAPPCCQKFGASDADAMALLGTGGKSSMTGVLVFVGLMVGAIYIWQKG